MVYADNGTSESEITKQLELHTVASNRTKYLGTDSAGKEESYTKIISEGNSETNICDRNVWINK